jgi:hypothetical protein
METSKRLKTPLTDIGEPGTSTQSGLSGQSLSACFMPYNVQDDLTSEVPTTSTQRP